MGEGWIKLHRGLHCHWLWDDKPFSYGQAWIDLLMMVSHKDNKTLMDGTLITVPAGTLITSEIKLSDRWGWSRTKTRTFLKLLESDGMIVKKSDNKKTTISVENWGKYQANETTEEQQKDSERTSEEHQKNTNKNVLRMVKNVKNDRFTPPTLDEVKAYCKERNNSVDPQRFIDYYTANGWVQGKGRKPIKDWKACLRTWEQREKKDKKTAFNTFDQRTYDYVDLTERLAAKG